MGIVAVLVGALMMIAGLSVAHESQLVEVVDLGAGLATIVSGILMRRGRKGGFVLLGVLGGAGLLWALVWFTLYLTGLVRPDLGESVWDLLWGSLFVAILMGAILAYAVTSARKV